MRHFSIILGLVLMVASFFYFVQPKSVEQVFREKYVSLNLKNHKEAKRPDKPSEAMKYWDGLHETPENTNPAVLNAMARQQIARAKKAPEDLLPMRFDILGPGNFAGRVRGLIVNPNDPDTLLVGSVSGGIWKTTNGGKFWQPVTSFEPTLSIGHLLVDPDNPNRVFAGTGEGFLNGGAARGLGIFVSNDFGETWSQLSSTNNEDFFFVNRLERIPSSNVLFAATSRGLFRSPDLGETWEDVDGIGLTTSRGFVDVKVNPANSDNVIAAYYGQIAGGVSSRNYLIRSTNGGRTFERVTNVSGIATNNISRHELGFGSDGVLYVAIGDNTQSVGTNGLFRSTDGGATFMKTASNTAFIERQGWYDLMVGVDPSDSNRVYMGAVDVFRTTDAGATISKISEWSPNQGQIPQYVHADIHVIEFHPTDPKTLWIGTDGGVYKSTDGGDNFEQINGNLSITQFYGIAVHPDGDRALGGTQDNGTVFYYGDDVTWIEWVGGDGGFASWDQQEPQYIYGSTPNGGMFGSNAQIGAAFSVNLPTTTQAPFIQPFTIDPNNGNRMMVGTRTIYFSDNIRDLSNATWQTSPTNFPRFFSSTTISPHDGKIAYAGDRQGLVFRTTDLGGTNDFELILDGDFGDGDTTWVEVDPHDPSDNTLYVTFGDYGPTRVGVTRDGGQTWSSIHSNLPEIPVFTIRIDPRDAKRAFVGTELGLWTTADVTVENPVWERYSYGTAYTRVIQLHWGNQGNNLWIATYGRGMIRANRYPLSAEFNAMPETAGDADGILDIGERQNLRVTLKNDTGSTIDKIKATLLGMDRRLEVFRAPVALDALTGNQSVDLDFEIGLSSWDTQSGEGHYQLLIEHGELNYTFDYKVPVAADPQPQTTNFFDGAEGETLLTHSAMIGTDDWGFATTQPRTGAQSWFASNDNSYSDKSLFTPWFEVTEANANFSFWLAYNLEGNSTQHWDGMVLELRTEGGTWEDVGQQTGIPYDGQLFRNSSLQLRQAWSGVQTDYRQGNLSLGAYQGQKVQLRFHLACDTGSANVGAWIDDIEASGVTWQAAPVPDMDPCADCPNFKGSTKDNLYFLAEASQKDQRNTMIAIVNTDSGAQSIEVHGFSSQGEVRGVFETELAANAKLWTDLKTLFPHTYEQIQWVQAASNGSLQVFGEIQNPGVRSAYPASTGFQDFAYIPHVGKNTALFQTYISAINSLGQSSTTQMTSSAGAEASLADPHTAYGRATNTAVGLFGNDLSTVDWARVSSTQSNLAAMEYFSSLPGETQVASLGLDQNTGNQLRFLHIAKDTGNFWTGIVYINVSDQNAQVTETYFDENGNVVETRQVEVAPSAKIIRLFDSQTVGNTVPAGAAWLDVNGDQNLIGYELFGTPQGNASDFFVGLQGEFNAGTELIYPHMETGANAFTGIVALNLGDQTGNISFSLYDASGQLLETQTVSDLAPKTKVTMLARDLFSAELVGQGTWIRANADASQWAGFLLWGDLSSSGRQNLSGIKAGLR